MTTEAASRTRALSMALAREDRTTPVTVVLHRRYNRAAQALLRPGPHTALSPLASLLFA